MIYLCKDSLISSSRFWFCILFLRKRFWFCVQLYHLGFDFVNGAWVVDKKETGFEIPELFSLLMKRWDGSWIMMDRSFAISFRIGINGYCLWEWGYLLFLLKNRINGVVRLLRDMVYYSWIETMKVWDFTRLGQGIIIFNLCYAILAWVSEVGSSINLMLMYMNYVIASYTFIPTFPLNERWSCNSEDFCITSTLFF